MASGGDTIAPKAAQAGHGRPGTSMCATTATTRVVNSTAPMASDATPIVCRRSCANEINHAPSISSGGRKMTSTRAGSSAMTGKPGKKASSAPPQISATAGGSPSLRAAKCRAITASSVAIISSNNCMGGMGRVRRGCGG